MSQPVRAAHDPKQPTAALDVASADTDAGSRAVMAEPVMSARSSGVAKRSISLSVETAEAVEKVAGPGQFSAYVEGALRRQLQRDHLAAVLDGMEAETGPADEAEVSRIEALLRR